MSRCPVVARCFGRDLFIYSSVSKSICAVVQCCMMHFGYVFYVKYSVFVFTRFLAVIIQLQLNRLRD